jgi:hypothetical protein
MCTLFVHLPFLQRVQKNMRKEEGREISTIENYA